jgi:hypothetical protein
MIQSWVFNIAIFLKNYDVVIFQWKIKMFSARFIMFLNDTIEKIYVEFFKLNCDWNIEYLSKKFNFKLIKRYDFKNV